MTSAHLRGPSRVLLLACALALPALPAAGQVGQADSIPFAETVARLSEPGGYFDTDNLISNETGYLHVLPTLSRIARPGGVYLGVGPDQNFSYIAAADPALAIIVDIRRDNLLHHLFLKALFQMSADRGEYLSRLTGRPAFGKVEMRGADAPAAPSARSFDAGSAVNLSAEALVAEVDAIRVDPAYAADTRARIRSLVASYGIPLRAEDLATIDRYHGEFVRQGLDLRFRSTGRSPRPYYPTLRELVLATDLEGRRGSFLAAEDAYQKVKSLQARGRVLPVVGDLGGEGALPAIATFLQERGLEVSAFYTSNVEFYLFPQGTFDRFARSVASLPAQRDAVLIRSIFLSSFWGEHPLAVPGVMSVQVLERFSDFVSTYRSGGFPTYSDLATENVFR
jgi:hypothetical protein